MSTYTRRLAALIGAAAALCATAALARTALPAYGIGTAAPAKQTYANPYDGYTIDVPNGWHVQAAAVPGGAAVLSDTDFNVLDRGRLDVDIVNFPNPDDLTLEQVVAQHDQANLDGLGVKTQVYASQLMAVDGKPGMLRDIGTSMGKAWELFLLADGKVYLLAAHRDLTKQDAYRSVVQSIKFGK